MGAHAGPRSGASRARSRCRTRVYCHLVRSNRTVRVEMAMTPELVAEIDECRGTKMARARWIENVIRAWLGYRVDLLVLTPDDDARDHANAIPLSLELLEVLCKHCVEANEKPAEVIGRLYDIGTDERVVVPVRGDLADIRRHGA
jgi:hypothetical protein